MVNGRSRMLYAALLVAVAISVGGIFLRSFVFQSYAIDVNESVISHGESSRQLIANDALACEWAPDPFLIFSANVFSPLIYYSHLFPALASVLLGFFIWRQRKKSLLNGLFVFLVSIFAAWSLYDLVLWATANPDVTIFVWSVQIFLDVGVYMSAGYLCYVFFYERDLSFTMKVIAVAALIPVIFLAPTALNLASFDYTTCDREATEGGLWHYVYLFEILIVLWVAAHAVRAFRAATTPERKKQILSFAPAIILFLVAFSWGNIVGSLTSDWSIPQYGLFGMPIFLAVTLYLIVKYQTFQVQTIAASALVSGLWTLLFSILFLADMETARPVIVITLVFFAMMGLLLVRSVRREIAQRHLIEKQEKELEIVNKQQENLLHFMSHEVKGYLTEGQAGFASIVEGDYGAVPDSLKTMATNALVKVRKGVATIMDILKASDMKKGTVAYKKDSFNFRKAVETIAGEQKAAALEKGLGFEVNIAEGKYVMTGDAEKVRDHVIRNLMDNAVRYSPTGTIHVELSDGGGKIRFSVKDNGVGITEEDMQHLFTEGGHGKDSIKVNVHSTGYGLFIAKQVVDAHGGKIWAESEGEGKGATFIAEFHAI
ncbi:MAG: ATP-binding protein [Patescibacteria group bacterium]